MTVVSDFTMTLIFSDFSVDQTELLESKDSKVTSYSSSSSRVVESI